MTWGKIRQPEEACELITEQEDQLATIEDTIMQEAETEQVQDEEMPDTKVEQEEFEG